MNRLVPRSIVKITRAYFYSHEFSQPALSDREVERIFYALHPIRSKTALDRVRRFKLENSSKSQKKGGESKT